MEKLKQRGSESSSKPHEIKREAETSNIVGDFTAYKPSDEQAPSRQYRRQLNECRKQLNEYRRQLGETLREEDDLRGKARNMAEGAWKLRTLFRDFRANMQKANSLEAQITEIETFRDSLRGGTSVNVMTVDAMVKTDKYVKDVLSVFSERKKAQANLNGILAKQEMIQKSQESLSELTHSAETVSEEVREELERVSKETVETVEQGERLIEEARGNIENINKDAAFLHQRLNEHIEELENATQNMIDGCEITRKKSKIKVGRPEEMFVDEFKDLQNEKEKIREQIGILEEEARTLEEKMRLEEEKMRLEEEQKRLKEEQVHILEEKVHTLEEKKSALEKKKRVLEEQKRLLLEDEIRVREEQMKELEEFLQENKDSTSDETALGTNFLEIAYSKEAQRALAIFKLGRSVEHLSNTIEQEAEREGSTLSALLGSEAAADISNYNRMYLFGVRSYIREQNSNTLATIEDNLTRAKQVFQSYFNG
jgi:myosin heavy subunit